MYLSRLVLNVRDRRARRDAADAYDLHRTLVTRAFGAVQPKTDRILFRVEPEQEARALGGPVVLVQSVAHIPDWDVIEGQYFLRVDGPRPFEPRLRSGERFAFRLVANPVMRTAQIDESGQKLRTSGQKNYRHRRLGLIAEEEQRAWLERKGAAGGFRPLYAEISPIAGPRQRPPEITHVKKSTIPHTIVRYDGVLELTDADAFVATLRDGIGPAKAFGCGLLTIKSLR